MITFRGVGLSPGSARLREWIARNFSGADHADFLRSCWDGAADNWRQLETGQPKDVMVGRLHWPVGASRFATFYGIVNDTGRAALGDSPQTGTLDISDGNGGDISTQMLMLPPRPLQSAGEGLEGLWLITLVDDRFKWQQSPINVEVVGGTTTWASLIASVGAALHVTIASAAVSSSYLKPSVHLSSHVESAAILLDTIAHSMGRRVVREFDGTVKLITAAAGAANLAANVAGISRVAGGEFRSADRGGDVPATVRMRFPLSGGSYWTADANLADLALTEYAGITTRGGILAVHDTALAQFGTYYASGGASGVSNAAELGLLVSQWATDWYRWRTVRGYLTAAGVYPWAMDGANDVDVRAGAEASTGLGVDVVEAATTFGGIQTRVSPADWWDVPIRKTYHYGTYGESDSEALRLSVVTNVTCVGGVMVIERTTVTVPDGTAQ